MIEALIALLVIGILGFVVVTVVVALVGTVFGLAFAAAGALLHAAPFVLAGWLLLKLLRRREPSPRRLSRSDQEWLDT